ncbi:MAG: alpha/beta hydrolase [bacterium]|nr:alpha/beta hydrolase [bacterium]
MTSREHRIDVGDSHHVVIDHAPGNTPGYFFLHGLGSTRVGEKSDSLMAHAAARGRAFTRCDLRGHGESSGTIGVVTIGELIADTTLLLERFGPAVLVGSSLGGMVSAFVAANRPDLVTALALLAPALGFVQHLDHTVDDQGRMRLSDGRCFPLAQRVLDDARLLDERALPGRITVPTLVVHGSADDTVPATRSQRFHAAIPHSHKDLWIVTDGDHRLSDQSTAIWHRLDTLLARERP